MKTPVLLTILFTVLSLNVKGQSPPDRQGFISVTTLSFIKPEIKGLPADSLVLSTSLDEKLYGFPFLKDTLVLDVNTFPPVDELSIELFRKGRSLGRKKIWVGGAYADVYLSLRKYRTNVDSVTGSTAHTWYQEQLDILRRARWPERLSRELLHSASITRDGLMALAFANTALDLPTMTSYKLDEIRNSLVPSFSPIVRAHPRYTAFIERVNIIDKKPPNFKRYNFLNAAGAPARVVLPADADFYVIDLYQADHPISRRVHQQIANSPVLDSLFTQVAPMISISSDASPALWGLYVKDNDFGWQHLIEDVKDRKRFSDRIALPHRPVFLLVSSNHRIFGAYYNFGALVNVIRMKTSTRMGHNVITLPKVY